MMSIPGTEVIVLVLYKFYRDWRKSVDFLGLAKF